MMFLLQTPFPTPTPSLAQAAHDLTNTVQDTQALVSSVKDLTALGVLALFIIAIILYIVLVARKRKGDDDTLTMQQQQTGALISQMQEDRKERQALQQRLFERDELRENRVIESISALTSAIENFRVGIVEVKAIVTAFNTRDMKRDELDRQRDETFMALQRNYDQMNRVGSEPVQEIRAGVKTLLERSETAAAVSTLITEYKSDRVVIDKNIADLISLTNELAVATSVIKEGIRTLQKVKTGEIKALPPETPAVQTM